MVAVGSSRFQSSFEDCLISYVVDASAMDYDTEFQSSFPQRTGTLRGLFISYDLFHEYALFVPFQMKSVSQAHNKKRNRLAGCKVLTRIHPPKAHESVMCL